MNPLQRALIEKTGHDNGFEHVLAQSAASVTLASARHRARAVVSELPVEGFNVLFQVATLDDLAHLVRRAASLSQALPSQAARDYQAAVSHELAQLPPALGGTEVERLVRQRIGQSKFREAMLDYWGGACAVTGIAIPDGPARQPCETLGGLRLRCRATGRVQRLSPDRQPRCLV